MSFQLGDITKLVPIVSLFNPAVGAFVATAANVADTINQLDDKKLDGVSGLSAIAADVRSMAETGVFDADKLKQSADAIESIALAMQKITKLVG